MPSKAFSSLKVSGRRIEVAALDGHALQAAGEAEAAVERCKGRRIAFHRMDLGIRREPQREGAAAGKQVGDLLGLAQMAGDQVRHRLLGRRDRLDEAA